MSKQDIGSFSIPPLPMNVPVMDRGEPLPGISGTCIRMVWMVGGKTLLVLAAFFIMENIYPLFMEIFYWLTVVALIAARYVDVAVFHGTTCSGEPSTMRHFYRYAIGLLIIASAVFAVSIAVEHWLWPV